MAERCLRRDVNSESPFEETKSTTGPNRLVRALSGSITRQRGRSVPEGIKGIKTSLNLRTRRVYHPWLDLNGGAEKPNEIKLDEY